MKTSLSLVRKLDSQLERRRMLFVTATGLLLAGASRLAFCDDEASSDEESDASKYAEASAKRANATKVELVKASDTKVEMQPKAVFHYDDQPRRILDGRLWLWKSKGRPVAMQKVEYITSMEAPAWTHCLSSFSSDPIRVTWPNRPAFTTNKPGIEYVKPPELPAVAKTPAQIRQQSKRIAERITAKIESLPGHEGIETMRLLTRAITEFEAVDEGVKFGVIYGFAANGTNPDMFVVIEAMDGAPSGSPWKVGFVRMTSGGLDVSMDDTKIWSVDYLNEPNKHQGNWTFFHAAAQ
jgi:hypothetical protein